MIIYLRKLKWISSKEWNISRIRKILTYQNYKVKLTKN